MAYREVRIREARNKLVFRYDPDCDRVELFINGQRCEVDLRAYWPIARRLQCGTIGVDFEGIAGEEQGA